MQISFAPLTLGRGTVAEGWHSSSIHLLEAALRVSARKEGRHLSTWHYPLVNGGPQSDERRFSILCSRGLERCGFMVKFMPTTDDNFICTEVYPHHSCAPATDVAIGQKLQKRLDAWVGRAVLLSISC